MPRQPIPGSDAGTWGTVLNDYLSVSIDADGTLKSTAVTTAGAEATSNKDTDGTLAANSDTKYPSQKAVKTYADTKLSASETATVTNKRITKRVRNGNNSLAIPNFGFSSDGYDCITFTGMTVDILDMSFAVSSPSNFDSFIFRLKDNGSPRTITWGSLYASRGVTLPTTTIAGKVTTVGFFYNSVTSTWDCVACVTEA